jgi:hypothetical protein
MRLKATNRIIKSRIAAFGYFTKSGKQKEKISNYQTCEAGNNSLIPKKLINDIFLNFKF